MTWKGSPLRPLASTCNLSLRIILIWTPYRFASSTILIRTKSFSGNVCPSRSGALVTSTIGQNVSEIPSGITSSAIFEAAPIYSTTAMTFPTQLVPISLPIFLPFTDCLLSLIRCHQCCVWSRGVALISLSACTLPLNPIYTIGFRGFFIFQ
jgi:hypothetical protein